MNLLSNLEKISLKSLEHKNIEDILEKCDWKSFENVVKEIFQENGFHTKQNFRFKTKKRYEIDVIAVRNSRIFCIDCKWWGRGRYKKTGLKNAIKSQEIRTKELQKFLKGNPIAKSILKIHSRYPVYPLIVTLHEEDMIKEGNTFVVPVWKLNKFATEIEQYI